MYVCSYTCRCAFPGASGRKRMWWNGVWDMEIGNKPYTKWHPGTSYRSYPHTARYIHIYHMRCTLRRKKFWKKWKTWRLNFFTKTFWFCILPPLHLPIANNHRESISHSFIPFEMAFLEFEIKQITSRICARETFDVNIFRMCKTENDENPINCSCGREVFVRHTFAKRIYIICMLKSSEYVNFGLEGMEGSYIISAWWDMRIWSTCLLSGPERKCVMSLISLNILQKDSNVIEILTPFYPSNSTTSAIESDRNRYANKNKPVRESTHYEEIRE